MTHNQLNNHHHNSTTTNNIAIVVIIYEGTCKLRDQCVKQSKGALE